MSLGLLFSDFIMWTMPSIVKLEWTNPLRFNFLPLKAMFSFISQVFIDEDFSVLVFWIKPCFSFSNFCNFLLFNRALLQCFLFRKCTIVFYDLLLSGFPILWHASTSLGETLTSISESTEITVSSKSLSETCAGVPETTILLLLPYCSNALTEDILDMTSFSSLLHFSCNVLFSSCSLFFLGASKMQFVNDT